MKKIKNKVKKKDTNYNKIEEVNKTTSFLKEILNPHEFVIFVKLGETDGSHLNAIQNYIKECNTIINIQDKNLKTKYSLILQNNIRKYIAFIEENIKTMPPLLNYLRLFIINSLLCQYAQVDNILYFKYKDVGLINDYKKIFHDFNIKLDSFIEPFYISSNGEKIQNEIILPKDIKKEIKEVSNELSDIMINLIKYNQTLFNNLKTKENLCRIDLDLNKKVRKEIVLSNEVYLQSEEIRNELDLMIFLKINIENIKLNMKFNDYASCLEETNKASLEVKKDLKSLEEILYKLNEIIIKVSNLINLG